MESDDGHCMPLAIGVDCELTPVSTFMKQKAGLHWRLLKEYFVVLGEKNGIITQAKLTSSTADYSHWVTATG